MKHITLALFFLCVNTYAQIKSGYEYKGRTSPSIKQEKLSEARFINDIMPEFCRNFGLPGGEYYKFHQLIKLSKSTLGNYMYPNEYFYRQETYEKILDYVSVEISSTCNGKILSATSANSVLSKEQKNILNSIDVGADINVKINFKYKYETPEYPEKDDKVHEGKYKVTVVPEKEAEYPGGPKQITNYINENVINKIPKKMFSPKVSDAIVKFTIDEEGKVINAKTAKTSSNVIIDKLLIDAINKMPSWKPAENTKGIKIKQEYSIPLGSDGC
ncbi:MAG: energy transducer TonB [Bacteroidetes bacterium]|nr:energy transducer TonB [Bacteroidota bacterium]